MKKLIATIALVASLTGLGVLTASPASAATGRVIANPSVVIRSGASTSNGVIGSIPYGTSVNIQCTVTGQRMTGPYGATTIWNRVAHGGRTGYVTDAYIYTGTNNAAAPRCSTAAPAPTTRQTRAVAWARAQLGATGWNNLCERFVEQAYGTSGRYASAYAHYQDALRRGVVRTTGTPPAGAIVFFDRAAVNGNYGHVMISEGNGNYITSATTVRRVSLSWPGARYLGWAPAPSSWPGR